MEYALDNSVVRECLGRYYEGDPTAFEELYEHCRPAFIRIAMSILHSEERAEDATQTAFETILRRRFYLGENIGAYLIRIVKSRAIDMLRLDHTGTYGTIPLDDSLINVLYSQDQSALAVLLEEEAGEIVQSAVRDLPRRQREVVLSHYFEGLSMAETAERIGVGAVGTVKIHGHRGRGNLRRAMQYSKDLREAARTIMGEAFSF